MSLSEELGDREIQAITVSIDTYNFDVQCTLQLITEPNRMPHLLIDPNNV